VKLFTILGALCVVACSFATGFEQLEGYHLGPLNGQQGWVSTNSTVQSFGQFSSQSASIGHAVAPLNMSVPENGMISTYFSVYGPNNFYVGQDLTHRRYTSVSLSFTSNAVAYDFMSFTDGMGSKLLLIGDGQTDEINSVGGIGTNFIDIGIEYWPYSGSVKVYLGADMIIFNDHAFRPINNPIFVDQLSLDSGATNLDVINISYDNVGSGVGLAPEPTTVGILGIGLLAALKRRR